MFPALMLGIRQHLRPDGGIIAFSGERFQAHVAPAHRLALLWQIYWRFPAPIDLRQCGHRGCGSRTMSSTMAWRTAGKVG